MPVIFFSLKCIDVDVINMRNKKPIKTTIPPICAFIVVNGCGVKLEKYKQTITADRIKYENNGTLNSKNTLIFWCIILQKHNQLL